MRYNSEGIPLKANNARILALTVYTPERYLDINLSIMIQKLLRSDHVSVNDVKMNPIPICPGFTTILYAEVVAKYI